MGGGPQRLYSLIILGLFADHFSGAQNTTVSTETFDSEQEGTAPTNINPVAEHSGPGSQVQSASMSQTKRSVVVKDVPSSLLILEGHPAILECKFTAPVNANVTWRKSCSPNCSQIFNTTSNNMVVVKNGVSTLTFHQAKIRDSGMYYCMVYASESDYGQSCGTYLWVRRPRPSSFLNIRESVKNKIITAEGFLLLIFAIGPGLFLLLRKRWENESLLQAKKKKYEEENLYEGLNLDDCSMYEDISRGLQATYQDIGNVKVIDLQLENPEKP